MEEEKKAIEELRYWRDYNIKHNTTIPAFIIADVGKVLNLIEKQDKMIDFIIEEHVHIPENEIYKIAKIYEEVKDKTELKGIKLKRYCIKEYFRKKVEEDD